MASLQEQLHQTLQSIKSDAAQYGALISKGASFAGVDQGIDFTGGPASVYALGAGTVERIASRGSGWPGQGALLTYRINDGPLAGRHVYVAEDFTPDPSLKVGSPLQKGQSLGIATGSGLAPGIEVGYADPSGRAFGSSTGGPQVLGRQFDSDVRALSSGVKPTLDPHAGFTIQSANQGAGQSTLGKIAGGDLGPSGIDVLGGIGDTLAAPKKLFEFITSWRFAEVVGGFLLLIVGLVLLGRQFGLSLPSGPLPATSVERRTQMVSHTLEADRPAPRRPSAALDYGEVPF